jgi:hypothetical protein
MTKARQRERRKRRQAEMQAGAGVSTVEDERPTDEAMVKMVDAVFRRLAEQAAADRIAGPVFRALSVTTSSKHHLAEQAAAESDAIEDAIDGTWALFEAGFMRLVAHDDDRVDVEPCGRAEQHAQARRNRPLAELRRRLLAETEGRPSG